MKKHARLALKAAQLAADPTGCVVEFAGQSGKSHYLFAVRRDGVVLGSFTISESPKCKDHMPDHARQRCKRLIRDAEAQA